MRAPAMRAARQPQSVAVFVASSTTKPLPSHTPSGHDPLAAAAGGTPCVDASSGRSVERPLEQLAAHCA